MPSQAKLPEQSKPKRSMTGTKPCNKPCGICPYVQQSKEFASTTTGKILHMQHKRSHIFDNLLKMSKTVCGSDRKKTSGKN